ncbi:MAG: arginase family protein [Candidatus Omnitrophica bacterium]|nr:arginase family protein [Candidatus Omnitrophota bacterium]
MLKKYIRILNFDNSIIQQPKLLSQYPVKITDFTSLASSVRLYMSGAERKKIADSLLSQEKDCPTFLGSGDFHHISEILTSQINQPTCLVIFDFHPDWDILPPRFGCGSWVSQALENKNISKCILIGMGSDDLSGIALQTGNLASLTANRLEIYPFRHKPSRIGFRHIPENYSITARRGFLTSKVIWHELEKEDLSEFILKLIKRLPTQKVYISIDKDCLNSDFALTNWEEGCLRLDQLLIMLKIIRNNLDIIGLDITGDYSPPVISSRLKAMFSRLDHPKRLAVSNCPADLITWINEQSNLAILQEMFS